MRTPKIFTQMLASCVILPLLLACNENGNQSPNNSELQKIFEVTTLHLSLLESLPPQLKIDAEGNAREGGWLNPQLVPHEYTAPPADGIYEFDFKAQPPSEAAIQVITPVKASFTMNPMPDSLIGVKIYAKENNVIAMLEQSAPAAFFEFRGSDEQDRFVIKLVDQEKINHARNLLAGNTTERPSVMGTIVKSKQNYNPDWNYHLAPESVSFFEVAVEVCDANMRYVEEHLDEVGGSFLPEDQWCPWSSRLTKEIDLH